MFAPSWKPRRGRDDVLRKISCGHLSDPASLVRQD
jgi:hypothetical protein